MENMTDDFRQMALAWMKTGKALNEVKRKELPNIDVRKALENLSMAFEYAVKNSPLRKSSGLVEQQYYYKKLYGK